MFRQEMIWAGFFLAASLLHLIYSWRDDTKKRAYTKPFPLLLLLVFYLVSARNPLWTLACALFASWLGDVLLIFPGTRFFMAGGLSFGFAHLFFVLTYLTYIRFDAMPWHFVVPAALIYALICARVIYALKKIVPNKLLVPMHVYLILNSMMNLFALMQLFSLRITGAVYAFVGALFFFVSDCILYFVRYHRDREIIYRRHFPVMLTYLAGEGLITFGMLKISEILS